jgi:hypothetical protein
MLDYIINRINYIKYNIFIMLFFKNKLIGRVGLEPTSSGHEPGMFPFTIPQRNRILLLKKKKIITI